MHIVIVMKKVTLYVFILTSLFTSVVYAAEKSIIEREVEFKLTKKLELDLGHKVKTSQDTQLLNQLFDKKITEMREQVKIDYDWLLKDPDVQNLPSEPILELLMYYNMHLNTGIYEQHWEWNNDPKRSEQPKLTLIPFHIQHIKTDFIVLVDFSLNSNSLRMYVINMKQELRTDEKRVNSYIVAHGEGSGNPNIPIETRYFSNINGKNMSSLGMYITDTKSWTNQLHGFAVRMHGLDTTNNHAYNRLIEIHGADYVHQDSKSVDHGSKGCFALDQKLSYEVIKELIGGTLLYAWIDPELLKGFDQQN